MQAEIKSLTAELSKLKTLDELQINPRVRKFLALPSTHLYLRRLKEILVTTAYIKVKKRFIASFFLKLCQYAIRARSDPSTMQEKLYRCSELVGMLQKKPRIQPVVYDTDRTSILQFLTLFFEPMLILPTEEENLSARLTRMKDEQLDDDNSFSFSHEEDLKTSLRTHLNCARCGNPAAYICRSCDSIAYCSIWCQQLGWLDHKSICQKDKKD